MVSYHQFKRKSLRLWKKVFFWLLKMRINKLSYVIQYEHSFMKLSRCKYIIAIKKNLHSLKDQVPKPSAANEPRRNLTDHHFPKCIPLTDGKTKPTRMCHRCSSKPGLNGNSPRRETWTVKNARFLCALNVSRSTTSHIPRKINPNTILLLMQRASHKVQIAPRKVHFLSTLVNIISFLYMVEYSLLACWKKILENSLKSFKFNKCIA